MISLSDESVCVCVRSAHDLPLNTPRYTYTIQYSRCRFNAKCGCHRSNANTKTNAKMSAYRIRDSLHLVCISFSSRHLRVPIVPHGVYFLSLDLSIYLYIHMGIYWICCSSCSDHFFFASLCFASLCFASFCVVAIIIVQVWWHTHTECVCSLVNEIAC